MDTVLGGAMDAVLDVMQVIRKAPRVFYLVRLADETGVSGTGIVADGVQFWDGTCVVNWATTTTSTSIYKSITDVTTIHGHNGKTRVFWEDIDFIHRPTQTAVMHDCQVFKPLPDGSCELFDGWPKPAEDYVSIRWYINRYGRRLHNLPRATPYVAPPMGVRGP